MAIASVDERVKKYQNILNPQMQEQINAVNQTVAQQKATVQDTYNAEISKTKQDYDDEHQRNLVQKYVNEQQIAENMANMGLTDSGLNRTQQTAAQLSYSNTASKIDRQLQSAVDSFVLTMNSKLTDIETSRIGSEASIKKSYEDAALGAAQKEYETEYDAQVSQVDKNKPLLYSYTGISKTNSDGQTLRTFEDNNGKRKEVPEGYNPYTNDNNYDTYKAEYKDKNIGFHRNGYQPKGLVSEGGAFSSVKVGTREVEYNFNGKMQKIWVAKNGNYFYWDGAQNRYIPLTKQFVDDVIRYYS